jgi:hypothetical protein
MILFADGTSYAHQHQLEFTGNQKKIKVALFSARYMSNKNQNLF